MKEQRFYDPGALDHPFTLERILETPDGFGGTDVSWLAVAQVWGTLQPKKAFVLQVAQQADERLRHEICLRFRTDIRSGWRLTGNGRVFEIETVHDPDERQRYLVCTVQELGR